MGSMTAGQCRARYVLFEDDGFHQVERKLATEAHAHILVNGRELAALMCSPYQLDELAIGFLRSEGFITDLDDIALLHASDDQRRVDIWLKNGQLELPARRVTTSGLGGGVTFDRLANGPEPLLSMRTIRSAQVIFLMKRLVHAANLYQEVGGVHTAALSNGEDLLMVAEDIARHNTLNRLWGRALKQSLVTRDKILVCTGRISSEMLAQAARMRIPIVISQSSPTSLSIAIAKSWNITVIGYARGNSFHIYSAPERVLLTRQPEQQHQPSAVIPVNP